MLGDVHLTQHHIINPKRGITTKINKSGIKKPKYKANEYTPTTKRTNMEQETRLQKKAMRKRPQTFY